MEILSYFFIYFNSLLGLSMAYFENCTFNDESPLIAYETGNVSIGCEVIDKKYFPSCEVFKMQSQDTDQRCFFKRRDLTGQCQRLKLQPFLSRCEFQLYNVRVNGNVENVR